MLKKIIDIIFTDKEFSRSYVHEKRKKKSICGVLSVTNEIYIIQTKRVKHIFLQRSILPKPLVIQVTASSKISLREGWVFFVSRPETEKRNCSMKLKISSSC